VVGGSVVGGSILIVGCRQAVFRVLSFVLFLLRCSLDWRLWFLLVR
jgi:hypothetical protein